jgi:integrase
LTTSIELVLDTNRLTRKHKAPLARTYLRKQRFYELRHAAATLTPRDGLPEHECSAMLGHSKTSNTLNVYSHVLPGGHERAAAAMDRLLG